MKKHVLIFASLFFISLTSFAQDKINLVLFSEDGDAFYAYINGIRQNDKPETNVKVTGLSPNVSLRVEFADKALPQLKQAYPLEPGFEHTFRIKRDMKKQLKIRYFGQTALNDPASQGAATVPYHSSENPMSSETSDQTNMQVTNGNGNTSVTSTTTTTKVNNTSAGDPNNVAVNINVGGMGLNMNVSGMGMDDDNTATMNSTTSTTVTRSSSSSSSSYANNNTAQPVKSNTSAAPSNAGCSVATSAANFSKMKQSVEAKPFSDTKMSTAKIATKNSCLSVNQVMEICKLFAMDDDKLTYAKYAYDYCVDKANYYQVSEVFSFSATTEDFNKFLEK